MWHLSVIVFLKPLFHILRRANVLSTFVVFEDVDVVPHRSNILCFLSWPANRSQEVLTEKSTSARCGEATVDNLLRRLVELEGLEPSTF